MKAANILITAICTIACMSFMGCDSDSSGSSDNTDFVNESSSTVTVKPAGDETFEEFTVAPSETRTVRRVGDSIEYTFTTTGEVIDIVLTNIEVIFSDPINL